jgi:hypothetical protein
MNQITKSQNKTVSWKRISRRIGFFLLMATFLFSFQNCAPNSMSTSSENTRPTEKPDMEKLIAARNDELLKLAATNLSCATNTECEVIEVGRKACGGPRGYVVISKRNDVSKLQALSTELINLEKELILREGLVSTCEFIMPPSYACVDSVCR